MRILWHDDQCATTTGLEFQVCVVTVQETALTLELTTVLPTVLPNDSVPCGKTS